MKEERKPEYPQKTVDEELQKMPHAKIPKIQASSETRTRTLVLVAG